MSLREFQRSGTRELVNLPINLTNKGEVIATVVAYSNVAVPEATPTPVSVDRKITLPRASLASIPESTNPGTYTEVPLIIQEILESPTLSDWEMRIGVTLRNGKKWNQYGVMITEDNPYSWVFPPKEEVEEEKEVKYEGGNNVPDWAKKDIKEVKEWVPTGKCKIPGCKFAAVHTTKIYDPSTGDYKQIGVCKTHYNQALREDANQ